MLELLASIIKDMKDPFAILAFVVAVGLFYLLLRKERNIAELHDCIETNMIETNKTIATLVTLVEVLVYGRKRDGNP